MIWFNDGELKLMTDLLPKKSPVELTNPQVTNSIFFDTFDVMKGASAVNMKSTRPKMTESVL